MNQIHSLKVGQKVIRSCDTPRGYQDGIVVMVNVGGTGDFILEFKYSDGNIQARYSSIFDALRDGIRDPSFESTNYLRDI
jgi:hypothetical protein